MRTYILAHLVAFQLGTVVDGHALLILYEQTLSALLDSFNTFFLKGFSQFPQGRVKGGVIGQGTDDLLEKLLVV